MFPYDCRRAILVILPDPDSCVAGARDYLFPVGRHTYTVDSSCVSFIEAPGANSRLKVFDHNATIRGAIRDLFHVRVETGSSYTNLVTFDRACEEWFSIFSSDLLIFGYKRLRLAIFRDYGSMLRLFLC